MTYAMSAANPLDQVYFELARLGQELKKTNDRVNKMLDIQERHLQSCQLASDEIKYLRSRADINMNEIYVVKDDVLRLRTDVTRQVDRLDSALDKLAELALK